MLTGIAQFLYCVLITNYPFNAFLGGCAPHRLAIVRRTQLTHRPTRSFSATVGQFVLTASMRSQVNPDNKGVFPTVSPERCVSGR